MSDKMLPVKMLELLRWMGEESTDLNSLFQIPLDLLNKTSPGDLSCHIFDEFCSIPIGPAAGPHTQMAQNIVAAYIAGARFFELKTVQKMDSLEFPKPCIDARDECYNTEWSTELSLEDAFMEYARAWIVLHLLHQVLKAETKPDFIFNMSIGYDLEGIKTKRMQEFIDGLVNGNTHPAWKTLIEQTISFFDHYEVLEDSIWHGRQFSSKQINQIIPARISGSVTLSTMHGCPPEEIEAIAEYLLREKNLHTYIKLNPTLLGFETVANILQKNGYDYIEMDPQSFTADLKFSDAIPMIKRLQKKALDRNLEFGVKLSNTLGVNNLDRVLPGNEKYMSGRSLFPLTILLADQISDALSGKIRISYSGGVDSDNIVKILQAGIYPITVVTDLLKPGGYMRLGDMVEKAASADVKISHIIDNEILSGLAVSGTGLKKYLKQSQMPLRQVPLTKLPVFDCYEAPCITACPIHQDVPQYIELAGKGEFEKCLELIYDKNPLPNITGYICDHQCEFHCTRKDYENPVGIREVKRIAAKYGKIWKNSLKASNGKKKLPPVAIVGAGPAGLSAAYFLIRYGFQVSIFEKEQSPGGIVQQVLPEFRIPAEALNEDIDFIRSLGVAFNFGVRPHMIKIDRLKKAGFAYIFYAIGAGIGKELGFAKSRVNYIEALDFLQKYKREPVAIEAGKNVVVIGGGNTAMDSSRVAKRLPGVKDVKIIYRRSIRELPADREEFEMAMADDVEFLPLLNPVRFDDENKLILEKMELGEPDMSGRAIPAGTKKYVSMKVDLIIAAIGEEVDREALKSTGISVDDNGWPVLKANAIETDIPNVFLGGDARSGPATVVEAIADARKFADILARKEDLSGAPVLSNKVERPSLDVLNTRRGIKEHIDHSQNDMNFALNESKRCLHCDLICNKCVEVCPNRANFAVKSPQGYTDPYQVVHIDDLCNECGNCATFCPRDGKPYRDKLTLFSSEKTFSESTNPGFFISEKINEISVGKFRKGEDVISFSISHTDHTEINFHNKMKSNAKDLSDMGRIIKYVKNNYNYLLLGNSE